MSKAKVDLSNLRMPAEEFDRMMRRALDAPPPPEETKKAKAKQPPKRKKTGIM